MSVDHSVCGAVVEPEEIPIIHEMLETTRNANHCLIPVYISMGEINERLDMVSRLIIMNTIWSFIGLFSCSPLIFQLQSITESIINQSTNLFIHLDDMFNEVATHISVTLLIITCIRYKKKRQNTNHDTICRCG